MKGFILIVVSLFCLHFAGFSQTTVTGTVVDSGEKIKLENAVVMLLQAKDSILIDYGRTDASGKFQLTKPNTGEYLVIVSYPKYADFYQNLSNNPTGNLGEIGLQSVAHLIEEVVIKGRAAITIKGDTTEYDASQFKVEQNAKVEDLLKVLPGITVDAAGNITAQGKTVKKVLVDGEEFFGDDPTLVTRNLRSDMVDKIQVFEKKSEQAERTGVDDGQREQTINVKLKEDAKNGIFGKALAGVGTDKYYMGQLMFNKFKGSQKISAYGLFGNNGTTSMNWEDAQKYGGDSGVSYDDEGGMSFNGSFVDPFSGQGVIGIPRAINSGVNYNDKFSGDKHKVNLSYKYGNIKSDGQEETNMSGVINNNSTKKVDTENHQHRMNLRYDWQLDSLNTLTLRGGATQKRLWSDNENFSENLGSNQALITSNDSREVMDNDVNNYNVDLLYTKKFMKKGRSLTFNGAVTSQETNGVGSLYSTFHRVGVALDSITDQRKNRDQQLSTLKGGVTYTEPLSKKVTLSAGYSVENSKNNSVIESWNKDASGDYNTLEMRNSSNYDFNRLSNNYQVAFTYIAEKLRLNWTNNLNDDNLRQINNYDNGTLERNFLTYNPRFGGNYNITKSKNLWFNYSGSNRLPSLNQIQPIVDNTDQTNKYEGNEDLEPSFTNSVNLGYNAFQVLSGSYTYIGGSMSLTNDPVSQNITSKDGVNYYRWANINGKQDMNMNSWAGKFFKIHKELGLSNSFRLGLNLANNNNFVNGDENLVKTQSYSFTYQFVRDTKTGLNFDLNFSPQYRKMTSNLSPDQNNNGFVFGSNGKVEYFLSKTLKFYTDFNYSYEAPTAAFDQKIERFLIHPGISKKFLKNESLVLDFTVNDLLNQNLGYSRTQSNSIFMQRRYDTIRRYYMLKVSWDFNKMFVK